MNRVRLGNRLKTLRKQRGYSQEQLANLIGVSRSTLSRYEKDKTSPMMDVLEKMAIHLDTTITWLCSEFNSELFL